MDRRGAWLDINRSWWWTHPWMWIWINNTWYSDDKPRDETSPEESMMVNFFFFSFFFWRRACRVKSLCLSSTNRAEMTWTGIQCRLRKFSFVPLAQLSSCKGTSASCMHNWVGVTARAKDLCLSVDLWKFWRWNDHPEGQSVQQNLTWFGEVSSRFKTGISIVQSSGHCQGEALHGS